MRVFSLSRDLIVETGRYRRHYQAVTNPQAAQVDRLYLDVGHELRQVCDELKREYANEHPELDEGARDGLDPGKLGVQVAEEATFLPWPDFPARLGRRSSRFVGEGLHFHEQDQILPAQLQALRERKPEKHHFRFAIINGFGANLGDSTMGHTALREVVSQLKQQLPDVSCDILFGPGVSPAIAHLLGAEEEVDRVLYQSLTLAELAQYDGYFDFTGLIHSPGYDEMPVVDWCLWWCGLDPKAVPPEHKRNRGRVYWNDWNAVQALLKRAPRSRGARVLFNPKASVPLRTMPEDIAVRFAQRLLEEIPEIQLVIDQPLPLAHERLVDLSENIDSPEKFKALIAQMDGVITVDTFAIHWADACAVPTVCLSSSVDPNTYPYYPYQTAVGIEHFTHLPGYKKTKLSEEQWEAVKDDYHAAWKRISPQDVWGPLKQNMAKRQQATQEPQGLTLTSPANPPRCVTEQPTPTLLRYRLMPVHAHVTERFVHLTQHLLKPGALCLMAGAPDARLAVTQARRVAPHGQVLVFEPRSPLARALERHLFDAGDFDTQVQIKMPLPERGETQIKAWNPWFEMRSTQWGNAVQAQTIPAMGIDALHMESCACLMLQSPMAYGEVLAGARDTLKRCRPFILMAPINRTEAEAACKTAKRCEYDFWAEPALPGGDMNTLLIVGVPSEKQVKIDGFYKVEV